MQTLKTNEEILRSKSPTEEEIKNRMRLYGESYYSAREALRNQAYGGTPPHGYTDWGTYFKTL